MRHPIHPSATHANVRLVAAYRPPTLQGTRTMKSPYLIAALLAVALAGCKAEVAPTSPAPTSSTKVEVKPSDTPSTTTNTTVNTPSSSTTSSTPSSSTTDTTKSTTVTTPAGSGSATTTTTETKK